MKKAIILFPNPNSEDLIRKFVKHLISGTVTFEDVTEETIEVFQDWEWDDEEYAYVSWGWEDSQGNTIDEDSDKIEVTDTDKYGNPIKGLLKRKINE
jgi:CBS domain containing-hemolysin-like protein